VDEISIISLFQELLKAMVKEVSSIVEQFSGTVCLQ